MNPAELHKKLIAAAKTQAPDDRVPYAFEKRVMAHLSEQAGMDQWVFWARGLWRAAVSGLAIVAVLGAVSLFLPRAADKNVGDLSQDFENTLLATMDQGETMP